MGKKINDMKNLITLLCLVMTAYGSMAQPDIKHSIYFSQKYCSDSLFWQNNYYLAHSNGSKYSTFWFFNEQRLAKLNQNWDTVSTISFKGIGENRADKIFELPNGNILIIGTTDIDDNGYMYGFANRSKQAWMLEVDTLCQFVKAKTFGCYAWITDASLTSDGHILIAGNTNCDLYEFAHSVNGSAQSAWIAKYDTAFQQEWIKVYDNDSYDGWPTIKEVTPERYIVCYSSDGMNLETVPAEAEGLSDLIVYYIDSSANILWKHRFGTPEHDGSKLSVVDPVTKEVYFINNTNYGTIGGDITYYSGNCWIQKVDTFGNNKGSKAYGGSGLHVLNDALWHNNLLWVFSISAGNIYNTDMDINTGLANTNDAWIAAIDTQVNLVGKYTLKSDYQDQIIDAFVYNNELYASGNVSTPGTTPYKCDTANSFKYVFKIGLAPLGIYESEQTSAELFTLYPNPSQNTVSIQILDKLIDEIGELKVYNIDGKTVYRKNKLKLNQNIKLNCSDWPKGNYIIQLSVNKTQQFSKQFIKL